MQSFPIKPASKTWYNRSKETFQMVRITSAYHTAINQVNTTAGSLGALSLQVLCRLLHPKSKGSEAHFMDFLEVCIYICK